MANRNRDSKNERLLVLMVLGPWLVLAAYLLV